MAIELAKETDDGGHIPAGCAPAYGASIGSTVTIEPLDHRCQPDEIGLNRFQIGVDPHNTIAALHVTVQQLDSANQYHQRCTQLVHLRRPLSLMRGPRLTLWPRLVHG